MVEQHKNGSHWNISIYDTIRGLVVAAGSTAEVIDTMLPLLNALRGELGRHNASLSSEKGKYCEENGIVMHIEKLTGWPMVDTYIDKALPK